MTRQSYDTDLTPAQCERLAPLLPPAKPGGRPRRVNLFEVVNAIFDLLRAGCAWRLLPHDCPAWPPVYHYFRQWQADGTWTSLN